MTPERSGDHDPGDAGPPARPLGGETIRETTIEGGELLLWSPNSEAAWIQTDAVVTLEDQDDPVSR